MNRFGSLTLSLLMACATAQADSLTSEQVVLTLDGAKKALATAVAYARAHDAPGGAIAIVDAGGHLLAFERLDGTFAAGAEVSIGKARTSAQFKQRTRVFEELVNNGRTAMTALADVGQHGFATVQSDRLAEIDDENEVDHGPSR